MCINKHLPKVTYDEGIGEEVFTRSLPMKNELQTESLRQLLLAQKVQLIDKMRQERGGLTSRAEAASDQFSPVEQSHAQNITERDTAFAIQEHDVAEVDAIERALQRMARGGYGICLVCECEIPVTRLLAFPAALRCIWCQAAEEKLAKGTIC
jgi:DnaK suppressor protein